MEQLVSAFSLLEYHHHHHPPRPTSSSRPSSSCTHTHNGYEQREREREGGSCWRKETPPSLKPSPTHRFINSGHTHTHNECCIVSQGGGSRLNQTCTVTPQTNLFGHHPLLFFFFLVRLLFLAFAIIIENKRLPLRLRKEKKEGEISSVKMRIKRVVCVRGTRH